MQDALSKLMALQESYLELEQLEKERTLVPQSVAELRDNRDELQITTAALQQEFKESEGARLQLSREIEDQELNLDRFQKQLQIVTDNQSYSAALKEIDTAKQRISDLEDEILLLMEKQTGFEEHLEQQKGLLNEAEEKLAEESKRYEKTEVGLDERYEKLKAQQQTLEESIPDQFLRIFRRIAASRKGRALAEAKDFVCQECYVSIRPQAYAEIMSGNRLIRCESCNRILYRLSDSLQHDAP